MNRNVSHILIVHWKGDHTAQEVDALYRRMGYLRTPYHYVIDADGVQSVGRPEEWPGGLDEDENLMVEGNNSNAIVVGVILHEKNNDKYSEAQKQELELLLTSLRNRHRVSEDKVEVLNP